MSQPIDRRTFITRTAALGAIAGLPGLSPVRAGLHAGPSGRGSKKSLVTVYLRGGADPLNIVVPYAEPFYHQVRPTIGIPAKDGDTRGVVALDERFGLHPALEPLAKWFKKGVFAPIVSVGSHHATRSHFDAQDFMEYAAPGVRTVKEGWVNRYLGATAGKAQEDNGLRGVAVQRLLPRTLRGNYPVLAVPQRNKDEMKGVLDQFEDLYGAGTMGKREEDGATRVGQETIRTLRRFYEILETRPSNSAVKYPRNSVGARFAATARLIKANAGVEAISFDISGWDHHAREGGVEGTMAIKLARIATGLDAFCQDLEERLDDVLVLVMTEFGRTVRENGNSGTDHGHGSVMFALGGQVDGGKVLGDWPGLTEESLYQGRDLRVTTDFREVFKETLEGFCGFNPPANFFPEFKPGKRLGFLKS